MKAFRGAVIGVFGLLMMSFSLSVRGAVPHEAFVFVGFIAVLLVFIGAGVVWRSGRYPRRH